MRTQRRIAPRRLPRWSPPVGWIPETTLICSPGIGIRPLALEEGFQLLAIGAAEDPDQREIDRHSAAYERNHPGEAMAERAHEPAGQRVADREQGGRHRRIREQLPRKARGQPLLDPE